MSKISTYRTHQRIIKHFLPLDISARRPEDELSEMMTGSDSTETRSVCNRHKASTCQRRGRGEHFSKLALLQIIIAPAVPRPSIRSRRPNTTHHHHATASSNLFDKFLLRRKPAHQTMKAGDLESSSASQHVKSQKSVPKRAKTGTAYNLAHCKH